MYRVLAVHMFPTYSAAVCTITYKRTKMLRFCLPVSFQNTFLESNSELNILTPKRFGDTFDHDNSYIHFSEKKHKNSYYN